ncbi:uncharacterized protein EDB91DRAFT_1097520 [Suillus paluster]|uniref:uncharacterized protein n=1 Tax=Suillus paluster TaxID=48578 RepID=UPI001B8751EB|nr:uncharacterized protein EDB91DRAFT_1097520 [Suillus paluster]KAG1755142.1 hypothetical protein EDB91DRAFT_1097520 [Suillus paluster]
MANKRRRSAFEDTDNGTDHETDPSRVVVLPIVSSTSKDKGTVATSRQTDEVPGDQTTRSSPPQKKLKYKPAPGRSSSAVPSTLMKQTAVSDRNTRSSSVSVSETSLRSTTSQRMSVRLAKKIHPFILSKSRDIYPYLAAKDSLDSAEPAREELGGTRGSTPSAPAHKKKGRAPRTISLADDEAKAALMEQWANLRMSQGTLLSRTTPGRDTTPHSSSNRGSQEPGRNETEIPSGEVAELDTLGFAPAIDQIEPFPPLPAAEPLPEMVVTNESVFTPAQAEELATENISSERLPGSEYDLMYPSSSPENIQATIENMAPSQNANEGTVETIVQAATEDMATSQNPNEKTMEKIVQASQHLTINDSLEVVNPPLQLLATDHEKKSSHPPGSPTMSKLDILPDTTISAGPAALIEDSSTRVSPSAVDIQLVVSAETDVDDVILGFHMLDLHEVLSPWVPVSPTAPSIYVPPAVQHLIAAMNHQLDIESQARRRAEELYSEEMHKRIKIEEVLDKLQKECGERREHGAIQPPPSLHAAPPEASARASPELHGQRDDEAGLTSTDITHPNVTMEGCSA